MINIISLDDHQIYNDGLRRLELNHNKLNFIKSFTRARDAISFLSLTPMKVHLFITDLNLKETNGFAVIAKIKKLMPDQNILVITSRKDRISVRRSYNLGAIGYINKDCSVTELVTAIRKSSDGEYYIPEYILPNFAEILLDKRNAYTDKKITDREQEILVLICHENSSAEIAKKLSLSVHTVNNHRKNIMMKLGVKNMIGLAIYAYGNNLIE
jgi:two-component system, NarL family, invasion response regulator UvrY